MRGVHAGYGGIEVLSGIDLAIPVGGIFAILGPNGAGKSTLLAVASLLHPVTSGEVLVAGRTMTGAAPEALARRGVCLVPEGRSIFPNLTVHENLRLLTYLGVNLDVVEEVTYAAFPILGERRAQQAGTLSGGEQQMLALARPLVVRPAVLLVDELSMGLAPRIVEQLYASLAELATAGTTIVAVEQFVHTILGLASAAAVMSGGRVVATGIPAELEHELSAAYLGA
jgi:branched-chain amino acid transport system ATP-binding protein